jgi:putative ABC transport system substrate-binding protein
MIRRRDFITLLGGAAAWPLAGHAQQREQVRRVGVFGAPGGGVGHERVNALQQELAKLGWVAGRNLRLDVRWFDGESDEVDQFRKQAAELLGLKVDVIVSEGTPATASAIQATSVIPIIFVNTGDPVGTGLVTSLSRPSGNATGFSNQSAELAGKRVKMLRDVVPRLARLGVLTDAQNPASVLEAGEAEAAAQALGFSSKRLEVRRVEEIAPALESFKRLVDGVHVTRNALLLGNADRIIILALGLHLPTSFGTRDQVKAGGLMSYGPDSLDLWRGAAGYVDRILRGGKPGDLPVQQPTKFVLAINLITARAIGVTVPPEVLALADEVIE